MQATGYTCMFMMLLDQTSFRCRSALPCLALYASTSINTQLLHTGSLDKSLCWTCWLSSQIGDCRGQQISQGRE